MVAAQWHTYQVLTKRSERFRKLLNTKLRFAAGQRQSGGSKCGRQEVCLRAWKTCERGCAKVRFLSVEPLLEDMGKLTARHD